MAWFHVKCGKLSIKDFENISKLGEKIKWFCEVCNDNIEDIIKENKMLKKDKLELQNKNQSILIEFEKLKVEMNELRSMITPIESNVHDKISKELDDGFTRMKSALSDIGKRIANVEKVNGIIQEVFDDFSNKFEHLTLDLKTEIKDETKKLFDTYERTHRNVENDIQLERSNITEQQNYIKEIRQEVQEKFDDEKDREKRKCNLIFYNIIESKHPNMQRRLDEDFRTCSKIIYEELLIENFNIDCILRLGKVYNDGKPRPILIQFATEREKWEILRRAKNLRNSTKYGVIYIARDMTVAERKIDKALREEMHQRREQGEDCFIKNVEVIRRKRDIRLRDFIPRQ